MSTRELLAFLAGEIARRRIQHRPLKVAIDGRCAAGKTALADALAASMGASGLQILRPSLDGFHHLQERRYEKGEYSALGYYEDSYDYQAIVDNLLQPLSGDVYPVLCREIAHDVRTNMAASAPPVSVCADAVLLFDGVFLFRRELNVFWDFRILVDIDADASLARALARDTGVIGTNDVVRRKYQLRYEPAWQIYLKREHPESKADVIVDNRDFLHPRILQRP